MKLLFFGSIREQIGSDSVQTEVSFVNLAELKNWLEQNHPFLQTQPYLFAVNNQVQHNLQTPLLESDTVALLPPFSGG